MSSQKIKDEAPKIKIKKGKKRADVHCECTVFASFNNTIVNIVSKTGDTISWGSAGCAGIKDSRKSTPFAAQLAAERAAKAALEVGVKRLDVRVKGVGPGRESAIRSLKTNGLDILSIKDVTGIPHNGCRPKKEAKNFNFKGDIIMKMENQSQCQRVFARARKQKIIVAGL